LTIIMQGDTDAGKADCVSMGARYLAAAEVERDAMTNGDPAAAEILELTATAATALMRTGELRAEDYARALLRQAEQCKSLNAFRTLAPDTVLEAARAADKQRAAGVALGRLHGLPVPVKDSVDTKNYPTSNGTAALRDFRP